jgi:putative transcriptional regulator
MSIRFKLKEILLDKNISQKDLASRTGLRPNTISEICLNKPDRVFLSTIEKICLALNIKIEELIELEIKEEKDDA